MAQRSLALLLLLHLFIFSILGLVEPSVAHRRSRARAFIEASCRTTRYPSLCVRCLSGFANSTQQNPQQLAQFALTVSLARAQYTRAYVLSVAHKIKGIQNRDYQTVSDCLHQIDDSVDQLSQSIRELRQMAQGVDNDFVWHTSNIEAWLSAAQTDASTCMDEFSGHSMGGKEKAIIKAKLLNVVQVTSNALALFHRFTAWHRAIGSTKKP